METEFWGVEVKRGESLKVTPGYGMILHLSQASLGEHKNEKGKESVSLLINVDGNKLVLGTLITNKLPQHQFDLLFDREFELSHDWKGGSVYFYGYKASNSLEDESPEGESDESESEIESEDDEDMPLNLADNGKPKSNAEQVEPELKAKQEKSESNAELEKPEGKAKLEKSEFKADQQKPESKTEQEKTDPKVKRRRRKKHGSKVNQDKIAESEGCNAPNKETDAGKDSVKIVEIRNEGESGKPKNNAEQVKPELKAKQEKPEFKDDQQKPESKTEQEKTDSKVKQRKRKKRGSKVNQDKTAEACNAPNKETDVGKDSVKIVETRKDMNPQEDDESTFEDLMSDDDEEDESQVSSHKMQNKRKKAKRLVPHETDGNKAAPLPGNEAVQTPIDQAKKPRPKPARTHACNICSRSFVSAIDVEHHTQAKHGDVK